MSWRKYGGINQLNTQNFINVNSIATEQISFRGPYEGYLDVCGVIHVTGNIITDSNSIVLGDEHIYNNLIVDKDTDTYGNTVSHGNFFVYQKIYLGTGADDIYGFTDISKMYFYGTPDGIAINHTNPTSVLDIEGHQTHLLNIHSTTPVNRNIIAQNVNYKGIAVSASDVSSGILFYNDVSINDVTGYGAGIYYTHATDSLVLDISNDLRVLSGLIVTKYKNQIDTIDHINDEIATIYNTTTGDYLHSIYNNKNAMTGTALSLVAYDNSSNTFLNIVSPDNVGMGVGGGNYPADSSRSFGTIGVQDSSGEFIGSQTIVSGADKTQNPSTVGINTYTPKTDTYVIDINGPMHIENNMITPTLTPNFEIISMKFCKKDSKYGYIVGSPSEYNSHNIYNIYPHLSYTTRDGGKSWHAVNVFDISGELTNVYINLEDIFVYDSSYAFTVGTSPISGINGAFYYTYDGGSTWKTITIDPSRSSINITKYSFTGISIVDSGPSKIAFLTSNDEIISTTKNGIYYYLDITKLFIQNNVTNLSFFSTSTGNLLGNCIDTYFKENFQLIFIAGYGGFKIYDANPNGGNYELYAPYQYKGDAIATPNTLYGANGDGGTCDTYYYDYFSIQVYDLSHILIAGYNNKTNKNVLTCIDNITNSKNWFDIEFTTKINDVYIVDISRAIAVGNNSNIFYTLDGYKTWININLDDFNPFKNSLNKYNSMYNLKNVFVYNKDSIVLSQIKNTYDTELNQLGMSETFFCYLPSIFNKSNDNVIDICGNMIITGDINVNYGGVIRSNNPKMHLLNENVKTLHFGNEVTNMYISSPNTIGNTFIQSNLDVSGEATFHKNIYLLNDVTTFSNLSVRGNSTVGKNLYVNNNIVLAKDISMIGNLYTDSDVYIKGNLTVHKNILFYGTFFVGTETNLIGNVMINKTTYIVGNLNVNGSITGNGVLTNNNDVRINGDVFISKDLSLNRNLYIENSAVIKNNLQVFNDTSFNGSFYVGRDTVLEGNLLVNKDSTFLNAVSFNTDIGMSGNLRLAGDSYTTGNIYVSNNATINGQLYLGTDLSLVGNLHVLGDYVLFDNNLAVNNNVVVNGEANFPRITNMAIANVNSLLNINGNTGEVRCSTFRPSYNEYTQGWYTDAYFLTDNTVSKNIYLGGANDTIFIKGNLQFQGESNVNYGSISFSDSKIYYLNSISYEGLNGIVHTGNNLNYGTSQGAGIAIYDWGDPDAAYFLISQDQLGFILKSSGYNEVVSPNTNRVKLHLQKLSTASPDSEIISVTPAPSVLDYYSENGSGIDFDYSIATSGIKTREILLRDASYSNANMQTIVTDLNIPNNTLNVKYLDVSSNTNINGNLSVNGNVVLNYNTPDDIFLINTRTIFNTPVTVNNDFYVQRIITNSIQVESNTPTRFNDVFINDTCNVGGYINANSDVNINGILNLNNNAFITGILRVFNDTQLNTLSVDGHAYLNNSLNVLNNTTLNSDLIVGNDTFLQGSLTVFNKTSINSLDVGSDSKLKGTLDVLSDVSFSNNLYVGNDLSLNKNLYVNSESFIKGNTYIYNLLSVSGSLIISNNSNINGKLYVINDVSINGATRIYNTLNQFLPGRNIQYGVNNLNYNTGLFNSAFGYYSLFSNTTGTSNTAIGYNALLNNTTGFSNTAIGNVSLQNNTSGNNNVALGSNTGSSVLTGVNNTFLGYNSDAVGDYSYSTAIGYNSKITGNNLIVLGTPFEKTVIMGDASLNGNLVVNRNVTISGTMSINNNANILNISGQNIYSNFLNSNIIGDIGSATSGNIFVKNIYLGSDNSGLLVLNGYLNQNLGTRNIQFGNKSLSKIFDGYLDSATDNLAMGLNVLENIFAGDFNVGIGNYALQVTNNRRNIALGYKSLNLLNGSDDNIGIGFNSMAYYNGTNIIDNNVQSNILGGTNTGSNIAVGSYSGQNMQVGQLNVMIGTLCCGNDPRPLNSDINPTGNYGMANTLIGYSADMDKNGPYSYSTAIGHNALITDDYQMVIGTETDYVVIRSTTPSTSTSVGALLVAGGIGIGGSINSKGSLSVSSININSTAESYTISTGALVVPGGIGIGGSINVNNSINVSGPVNISNTKQSTTTSTGALVVSGGVGIKDSLFVSKHIVGNDLYINSSTASINTTTGSVIIVGGVGIGGTLNVGASINSTGPINIINTTESITNTTGALTVNGGVGIGGTLNVGGDIHNDGSIVTSNDILIMGSLSAANNSIFNKSLQINESLFTDGFIKIRSRIPTTTTSNGSLIVTGGAGIGGDINIGGNITSTGTVTILDTTDVALSSTSGSLSIEGGVGIKKSLYVGDKLFVYSISIIGTTDSTTTSNGALIVPGGFGLSKTLNVGGNINTTGIVNIKSTLDSTTSTNGSLIVAGGLGVGASVNIDGPVTINSTLYSDINNTTSALLVYGGASFGGRSIFNDSIQINQSIFADGFIKTRNTTASTTTSNGSLIVSGGAGIASDVNIGGSITSTGIIKAKNTTNSTTQTNGSLIVSGGAGIASDVNIGGILNVTGSVTFNKQIMQYYGSNNIQLGSVQTLQNALINGITNGSVDSNVAIGSPSLPNLINGSNNIGIGSDSLSQMQFGNYNIAIGGDSLLSLNNTTVNNNSNNNVSVGYKSLSQINTNGTTNNNANDNIAMGNYSGYQTKYGRHNVFVGSSTASSTTSPSSFNTLIGATSDFDTNSGVNGYSYSTALGYGSRVTDNNQITFGRSTEYIYIPGTKATANTSTGALAVIGGAGIGGSINIGGSITSTGIVKILNTTASSTTTNGSLVVSGGVGIAGSLNVLQTVNVGTVSIRSSLTVNGPIYQYFDSAGNNVQYGTAGVLRTVNSNPGSSNTLYNVGFGSEVLSSLTVGSRNVGMGYNALNTMTRGSDNISIGYNTLSSLNNTSTTQSLTSNNISIGSYSLNSLTGTNSSNDNVSIGYNSGKQINTGKSNVFVGSNVASTKTNSSNFNTLIGAETDFVSNSIYSYSTALGYASTITDNNQVILGTSGEYVYCPGSKNVTANSSSVGALIVAGGVGIGLSVNIGKSIYLNQQMNQFYGTNNLQYGTPDALPLSNVLENSNVANNIAFGQVVLNKLTNGIQNIAIGTDPLYNMNIGNNNIAIGYGSMFNLKNTSPSTLLSDSNVALGTFSLNNLNTTTISSNNNVALGHYSGSSVTGGQYNTFVGSNVLSGTTTNSNYNTFIGASTGYEFANMPTNGYQYSTGIGYGSIVNNSNQIMLGRNSEYVVCAGSAQSLNTTSGALVVSGGAGISKNLNVGGRVYAQGGLTIPNGSDFINQGDLTVNGVFTASGPVRFTRDLSSTSISSGSLLVIGGVGISGDTNVGGSITTTGSVKITNTTVSNSSLSGSLIVAGGAGINGTLNIGGTINTTGQVNITSTMNSSNSTSGALIVTGGVGIGSQLNVNGSITSTGVVNITNTTTTTATNNGALIVSGGVGVGGSILLGGSFTTNGLVNITNTTNVQMTTVSFNGATFTYPDLTKVNRSIAALNISGGINVSGSVNIAGDYGVSVKSLNIFSSAQQPSLYNQDISLNDNSPQIANTRFVQNVTQNAMIAPKFTLNYTQSKVDSFPISPDISCNPAQPTYSQIVTVNSPVFFGTPKATDPTYPDNPFPNLPTGTNTYSFSTVYSARNISNIATTNYVKAQCNNILNNTQLAGTATAHDPTYPDTGSAPTFSASNYSQIATVNFVRNIRSGLQTEAASLYAPLLNPTLNISSAYLSGQDYKTTFTGIPKSVDLHTLSTSNNSFSPIITYNTLKSYNYIDNTTTGLISYLTTVNLKTFLDGNDSTNQPNGYKFLSSGPTIGNQSATLGGYYHKMLGGNYNGSPNVYSASNLYTYTKISNGVSTNFQQLVYLNNDKTSDGYFGNFINSTTGFAQISSNALTISNSGYIVASGFSTNGSNPTTGQVICNNLTSSTFNCGYIGLTTTGSISTTISANPNTSLSISMNNGTLTTSSISMNSGGTISYSTGTFSINTGGGTINTGNITIDGTNNRIGDGTSGKNFNINTGTGTITAGSNIVIDGGNSRIGDGTKNFSINNGNSTITCGSNIFIDGPNNFIGNSSGTKNFSINTGTGTITTCGIYMGNNASISYTGSNKFSINTGGGTINTGNITIDGTNNRIGDGTSGKNFSINTGTSGITTSSLSSGSISLTNASSITAPSGYYTINTGGTTGSGSITTNTIRCGSISLAGGSSIGLLAGSSGTISYNTNGGAVNCGSGSVNCGAITMASGGSISYTTGSTFSINTGGGSISIGGGSLNLSTGSNGLYWGSGNSRIVDDSDLRICTDDNMHFNTGCNSGSLGTERMIIVNSTGNVGINKSDPSYKLDVNGDIKCRGTLYLADVAGDPSPIITARTIPSGQGNANERTEMILFHCNDPANGAGVDVITLRAPGIRLQTYNDANVGDINNAGGSNDRLYIDPDGKVGIGTSSPGSKLDVNGSVNASSYNASSDYRIKENITTLDNTFTVDNLKPITYFNKATEKQDIGFIAHEVQESYPFLVNGEKDGEHMQSMNYLGLIGILVKEIQDLKKEVAELKSKIPL